MFGSGSGQSRIADAREFPRVDGGAIDEAAGELADLFDAIEVEAQGLAADSVDAEGVIDQIDEARQALRRLLARCSGRVYREMGN